MSDITEQAIVISDLEASIKLAIDQRVPTIYVGRPGIGKTREFIRVIHDVINFDFLIAHPAVHDPIVYSGLPASFKIGDNVKADFIPYGFLETMMSAKKPLVVFLDDLGQVPAAVQAPIAQLVCERQINGHKISDQVLFFGATNDRTHKAGVGALLSMLANRVSLERIETSLDDIFNYAYRANWSDDMIGFLKFRPKYLTDWEPRTDFYNTATPRSIEAADRVWQAQGFEERLKLAKIQGLVGPEFVSEFAGYLPFIRSSNMPDFEEIIKNPDKAMLPAVDHSDANSGSVYFAVISGLAKRANKKTFENILRYAQRTGFPAELRTTLIEDCGRVDREIVNTEAWSRWARTEGKYSY